MQRKNYRTKISQYMAHELHKVNSSLLKPLPALIHRNEDLTTYFCRLTRLLLNNSVRMQPGQGNLAGQDLMWLVLCLLRATVYPTCRAVGVSSVNGYRKGWMEAFSYSYLLQIVLIHTLFLFATNYFICTFSLYVMVVE